MEISTEKFSKGLDQATLVISKRKNDQSTRPVLSTEMDLSTESILMIFGYYWDIEVD